jgi:hypothetical protein
MDGVHDILASSNEVTSRKVAQSTKTRYGCRPSNPIFFGSFRTVAAGASFAIFGCDLFASSRSPERLPARMRKRKAQVVEVRTKLVALLLVVEA